MFEVNLSDAARADIRHDVVWWSENRSPDEAERWYMAVMEKIYSLEHMPRRCPLARESKQLGIDIHHLLFGLSSKHTHRILFEIRGTAVNVFRVLSTRQDVAEIS